VRYSKIEIRIPNCISDTMSFGLKITPLRNKCIGVTSCGTLGHVPLNFQQFIFMAALRSRCGHYIFAVWFLLLSSFFLSSPNLSRRRLNVYHTCTHGVALVRISGAGLKCAARGSLKIHDAKNCQKFTIWAPSHNFVGLYLRN